MLGLLIRMAIAALGLALAAAIIPGIEIDRAGTLALAAIALGVVNAIVRPLVVLLTLPITLLSLGLFLWVINGAMLSLVAWLVDGFVVDGFFSALFGAALVSLVSWLGSSYVGPQGKFEILVVKRETGLPPGQLR